MKGKFERRGNPLYCALQGSSNIARVRVVNCVGKGREILSVEESNGWNTYHCSSTHVSGASATLNRGSKCLSTDKVAHVSGTSCTPTKAVKRVSPSASISPLFSDDDEDIDDLMVIEEVSHNMLEIGK